MGMHSGDGGINIA